MFCRSTISACSARSPSITTAASASLPWPCASSRNAGNRIEASRRGTCGARSTRSRSNTERRYPLRGGHRRRLPRTYNVRMNVAVHPYAELTPDRVLDALDSVGLVGDGRMQALGSYENRVYQIGIEDAAPVVVKFYRPARWSDAAILEEHAFVAELAAREIPVVAPISLGQRTLHAFDGFRFAVYPRCGGRAPELSDRSTLEWMGRFLGRIHAVGAIAPFRDRPQISVE